MRIIVLFNLKDGVDPAAYEAWARGSDIPAVNALGSVIRFTVHKSLGLFGSGEAAPYQYVEVIDIADMEGFVGDISTAAFQEMAKPFQGFADNPQFILTENL